ncbi:MAG: anti-sigma F factor [Christensenellales bacterium]|jgi:stage II sporulation protein AB (anti-sigma F factor)|nr:anti-sigma F factor [Clostridium sp.]MDD7140257.1 anti-sigma F factor [Clostridium sp.]MDO4342494.1 anti-sigma F factor [Eubacteriales bacterium]MDY6081110.1 anti-sigma F factor [Eubacteriales bacterium]CCX42343.1 anti-sigma F factor [Clostridium sp. CAG:1024]
MADNEMRLDFLSLSENESFARSCAAAFCTQLNPTIEELSDVRTAISEAVTNAIIHGYENRSGMVHLRCTLEGDLFTATVRDDGVGIRDIEQARQPFFTTRPELERSGMGFTVMEAFMEEVVIESVPGQGTSVTMKKRIARRDGA